MRDRVRTTRSARLERWLQLAAENSITICQPSTPASHFHMLRQQALGEIHRPLVVMTPKSMLRNKAVGLGAGGLHRGQLAAGARSIRPTTRSGQDGAVVLRQGPVGSVGRTLGGGQGGLAAHLRHRIALSTAQADLGRRARRSTRTPPRLRWVQDEPENQGAWPYMALNLPAALAEVDPDRTWTLDPRDPGGLGGTLGRLGRSAPVPAARVDQGSVPRTEGSGVLHRPRYRGARDAPG